MTYEIDHLLEHDRFRVICLDAPTNRRCLDTREEVALLVRYIRRQHRSAVFLPGGHIGASDFQSMIA